MKNISKHTKKNKYEKNDSHKKNIQTWNGIYLEMKKKIHTELSHI